MFQKIIILFLIQINFLYHFDDSFYTTTINNLYTQIIDNNKHLLSFSLFNYGNVNEFNERKIYFYLSNFSYNFSFRFNIIQVEYSITFCYQNQSIVIPSDLSLYYDLHLICHLNKNESNLSIDSLAFINKNKYFTCIEYISLKEKYNFGIVIYKSINETSYINFTHYFFNNSIFNYNNYSYKKNKFFFPLFIEKEFYLNNNNISLSLKKIYIKKPKCDTKSNIYIVKDKWDFFNIYNHYFCYCIGYNCIYQNLFNYKNTSQICKYKFYLNMIEENKYLYNKTDYLLADFPGDFQSIDDAFPVFKKLINLKKNAYYMTINKMLLQKINKNSEMHNHIIQKNYINGDFIEKYFSLFLRLKAVISGAEFFSFNNLFYYIEYVTFVSLTHGINYFKSYLFKSYYGSKTYHKLVVSPSEKVISLAIQNGWKDNNLIKICLPKWDKFDQIKEKKSKKKNKSIFFFFTWRMWNKDIHEEEKLKSYYFKNILELINNKLLIKSLKKNRITLKFCLHHMLEIYKNMLDFGNTQIEIISQNDIFKCIANSNLLITDFSSVIFEFIYLNKPYIMFIPDGEDPNITIYYNKDYSNLIKSLKEDSIQFMNKFFDINQVVDKIIYYINNEFKLENNLIEFYRSFNLSCGNNTMKFINYLENLKN